MAESRVSTYALEILNSGDVSNAQITSYTLQVLISQAAGDGLPASDPDWASVVTLLRFNGDNVDVTGRHSYGEDVSGRVPVISSSGGKFGGYSTGTGALTYGYGWKTAAGSSDFDFGVGDFTVEGWFRQIGPQVYNGQLFGITGLSWRMYVTSSDNLGLQLGSNGTTANINDTVNDMGSLSATEWRHVCLERKSGVFRVYVNGVMKKKITGFEATALYSSPSSPLRVSGSTTPGSSSSGLVQVDEFRITKGVARYGDDIGFLLPPGPFPEDSGAPPEPIEIDTAPGELELTGGTPGITIATTISPVAGELVIEGSVPSLVIDEYVTATPGELVLEGGTPGVTISSNVNVTEGGSLIVEGGTPLVFIGTVILTTEPGALELTGATPSVLSELASFVSQQATLTLGVPPPPSVDVTQQAVLTAAKVVPAADVSQFGSLTLGKVIPPITVSQMANLFLVKPVIQPAILPEPENGGKETWTWLTDTLVADDGTEQRIALRDHPRRSFSERIVYDDDDLVRRHVQFMMDRFGSTFVLPLYHYRIKLTIHPVEGETSIYFDTSRMDVRPGAYVYLYDGELFQLCRVIRVYGDSVYVDLPVLYDFSDNVRVMPCAVCTAANNTSFDRKNPDYYGSLTLNAEEVVVTPLIRPANVQALETYDDLPLLLKRPIGTDFDTAHDMGLDRIDYGTGPVSLRNPWKHGQNTLNRRFIVHRRRPEDLDWWKRLADYAKGSQKPFLLPSGRQDFVTHTPAAPGGNRITVDGIKYGPSFFGHNAFRRVAISSAGGVHYATVWSATRDGDKNVLHFTPPYPTGPGWSQGQQVSFLLQVRIGDDKVELEHDRLHSFVDLNLRTVDDA